MPEQRIRVYFRKGERVRYISHLDVMRYWERAIRRAGMPLAYSQGFTPHPRISFAGPLPLGFLATREPLDVLLDERVPVRAFREAVAAQTVEDLSVVDAVEVPLGEPALQAAARWSDYEMVLDGVSPDVAADAIAGFLERESYPYVDERREKRRTLDLREGVATISARPIDGGVELRTRLRATQEMTVRPEMVADALFDGHTPGRITRTGVLLAEHSPAREAWLRRGRFQQ